MRPLPEGGTQADAFEQYKRRFKRDHPEARPPVELPDCMAYLWGWFWELNTGRSIGGMGTPMAIAPTEILAWCQLRRVVLEDWEISVLQGLDAAFLKAAAPRK
jgi:hypothetical protein